MFLITRPKNCVLLTRFAATKLPRAITRPFCSANISPITSPCVTGAGNGSSKRASTRTSDKLSDFGHVIANVLSTVAVTVFWRPYQTGISVTASPGR